MRKGRKKIAQKPLPAVPTDSTLGRDAQGVVSHGLTKAQFVKRLHERDVIEEIQRLGLWRSANDGDEHGFSIDDLWVFYTRYGGMAHNSANAKALRGRGPDFLADGAKQVRKAVRFLQQ